MRTGAISEFPSSQQRARASSCEVSVTPSELLDNSQKELAGDVRRAGATEVPNAPPLTSPVPVKSSPSSCYVCCHSCVSRENAGSAPGET